MLRYAMKQHTFPYTIRFCIFLALDVPELALQLLAGCVCSRPASGQKVSCSKAEHSKMVGACIASIISGLFVPKMCLYET